MVKCTAFWDSFIKKKKKKGESMGRPYLAIPAVSEVTDIRS